MNRVMQNESVLTDFDFLVATGIYPVAVAYKGRGTFALTYGGFFMCGVEPVAYWLMGEKAFRPTPITRLIKYFHLITIELLFNFETQK